MRKIPEHLSICSQKWGRRFIRKDKSLKLVRGKLLNKGRLAASTQKNLIPFFSRLTTRMRKREYRRSPSDVVPYEPDKQGSTGCTAALTMAANGSHLSTALILEDHVPLQSYSEYDSTSHHIYRSSKGFITREIFQHHMLHNSLPEETLTGQPNASVVRRCRRCP
jgi:hypothetical protein